MMKDERNYHLRLQEFCDCYMETDPKTELEKAAKGVSGDPAGTPMSMPSNFSASLSSMEPVKRPKDFPPKIKRRQGIVYGGRQGKIPTSAAPTQLADRIISIARSITHIDADQGKLPVSLGLRNDRIDVTFQFDRKAGDETFSILFPEL